MIERRKAALLLALMLASGCLFSVHRWSGRHPAFRTAVPDLEYSARMSQNKLVKADENSSVISWPPPIEKEPTASSNVLSTENSVAASLKDHPINTPSSRRQLSSNSLPLLAQPHTYSINEDNKNLPDNATGRNLLVDATESLGNSRIVQHQQDARIDNRFAIRPGFHFPQPRAVKPLLEVAQAEWMKQLQTVLGGFNPHLITVVTSNQAYRDVLLNWLVSATVNANISLETILIIAMDRPVHSLLKDKGLLSVLVTPDALLTELVQGKGVFNQVMMTRLAIIRLLNHWGYDVTNYDTDAILLRDPRPVFESHSESDIIGTFGKFPTLLYKEWGAALCTAVLMVRSSVLTERYWEATSRAHPGSYSDQERMNYGLRALNVQWELADPATSVIAGHCDNGLRVSLLPYSFACRSNCRLSERGSYHVWHKGGQRDGDSKRKNAEVGRVWLLKGEGLAAGCRSEVGEAWLRCLAGLS